VKQFRNVSASTDQLPIHQNKGPLGRNLPLRFTNAHGLRTIHAVKLPSLAASSPSEGNSLKFDGPHVYVFLAPAACAYTVLDHQPNSESNQGDLSVAPPPRPWLLGDFDNDLHETALGRIKILILT
jgi:hypothetical protein